MSQSTTTQGTATQTTLEEQTAKNQQSNSSTANPVVGTDGVGIDGTDGNALIVEPVVNEAEALKQELEQYKQRELVEQQKDMTEDQKEIDTLKNELHQVAMQEVLDSKYFNEKELEKYDYKELKAMGDVIRKVVKQGQPASRGADPKGKKQDKNEPVGIWKNTATGKWEP